MGDRNLARRRFVQGSLALAGVGLLTGCGMVPIPSPRPASLRRIGYLEAGTTSPLFEAFREGMRDLDYVEDQNLIVEYRNAEGNLERLPMLVAELVDLRVELIVVRNNVAAVAASGAGSSIPIVAAGADIVAAGLVTNIARPEGNMTGVSSSFVATVGKWVELLKETVPSISRLAAVLDPSGTGVQTALQAVRRAAQTLQLPLTSYDLRDLDQLPAVLSTATADGADGLVVVSSPVLGGGSDPRIGSEVLKSRLPAVAQQRDFAVSGGLLAHGPNNRALVRRSATYVDKILKGAKPGDLPIELPTTFDVVVNLKTAQALGITVPQSVLLRATEVME